MNTKAENGRSAENIILKTAGKTLAVLAVLLVLVIALFILLAPMKAGDFFYSLGMEKISATVTYSAAAKSGKFDDWWASLVRCSGADVHKKAYESADRLENDAEFNTLIAKKKISVNGVSYGGKFYVAYNKARSGLLAYRKPENRTAIWRYCSVWIGDNGWGTNIKDYVHSLNPVKGYIDALCENKKIPLDDIFVKLDNLYNRQGEFAEMTMTLGYYAKRDLAYYAAKLIGARTGEVGDAIKNTWASRIDG